MDSVDRQRGKLGFTLIELVVVLVVIMVLAAVLTPMVSNLINEARVTRAELEVVNISRAIFNFNGSSAEFVGKTVFHRRLRRPRCSPSLKASLASSAAAPALTLGCAPRCRLVWAMGNGASGGGSGHRV